MKKALLCLLTICAYLSLFSCTQDDEDVKSNDTSASKSKYSTTTEATTEPTTKAVIKRTASEAYTLAQDEVPNAILQSTFFTGATSYKITDHEDHGLIESGPAKQKVYSYDFYGIVYYEDHYGNVDKKKQFHVYVYVPLDASENISGMAYVP